MGQQAEIKIYDKQGKVAMIFICPEQYEIVIKEDDSEKKNNGS